MPLDTLHGPIEDDGDQGDFVIHSDIPPAPWREPIAEDEQDRAGPSRGMGYVRVVVVPGVNLPHNLHSTSNPWSGF